MAGRRRRNVGVCVECRQHKLKCDTEQTHPGPCSRCTAKSLDCAIDSSFKRTPARQKAREMAAELQRLRQDKATSQSSRSPDAQPAVEVQANSGESALDNPLVTIEAATLDVQPARLGPCTFNEGDIRERFRLFHVYFHPSLPILSPNLAVGTVQKHSPFLFWTVIMITCRIQQVANDNVREFEGAYTSLVQRASLTSPISLHTIQALLLICTWPVTARFQLSDPSYLYCSAAMAGAGFLNLDRPSGRFGRSGSRVNETDGQNMSRTWLGLVCVASSLNLWYGAPRCDQSTRYKIGLDTHAQQPHIPHELAAEAEILSIGAKYHEMFSPSEGMHGLELLVHRHEIDLEDIRASYSACWSDRLQLISLGVNVQLSATHLITLYKFSNNAPAILQVLRAMTTTAAGIVDTYTFLLETGGDMDLRIRLRVLPKSYYRTIVFTAFLLARFCCTNSILTEHDRSISREIVARIRDLFQSCSTNTGGPMVGDEPGRVANCLTLLLDDSQVVGEDEYEAMGEAVDQRLCSIIWGTLHRAYRLRKRAAQNKEADEKPVANAAEQGTRFDAYPAVPHQTTEYGEPNPVLLSDPFNGSVYADVFRDLADFDWIWGQQDGLDSFEYV